MASPRTGPRPALASSCPRGPPPRHGSPGRPPPGPGRGRPCPWARPCAGSTRSRRTKGGGQRCQRQSSPRRGATSRSSLASRGPWPRPGRRPRPRPPGRSRARSPCSGTRACRRRPTPCTCRPLPRKGSCHWPPTSPERGRRPSEPSSGWIGRRRRPRTTPRRSAGRPGPRPRRSFRRTGLSGRRSFRQSS